MTAVEFSGDIWRQKTRVPRLSRGVVCVILCLAVLVELRLVTDRQTQTRTQAHGYSTADAEHGAVKTTQHATSKLMLYINFYTFGRLTEQKQRKTPNLTKNGNLGAPVQTPLTPIVYWSCEISSRSVHNLALGSMKSTLDRNFHEFLDLMDFDTQRSYRAYAA